MIKEEVEGLRVGGGITGKICESLVLDRGGNGMVE